MIDSRGILPLFVAVIGVSPIAASAEPEGEVTIYKRIDGRGLKLYTAKPEGWNATDRRPSIVFFHGGGWVGGNPSQFDGQARYFANRGLVCIQAEYRLLKKGDGASPLMCVRDAKSAIRWVRAHAKELGIDPGRIAAAGGSAGGHLAAFVGMVEGSDDPGDDRKISAKANAMILFNPVLDNGPDGGWGTERVGEHFKELSPAHNVTSDDPPAIVFLGTQDRLIPVRVVDRFKSNMNKAGVRCDAVYADGEVHGFFNKEPWKARTLAAADRFLVSIGWLEDPASRENAAPGPKSN